MKCSVIKFLLSLFLTPYSQTLAQDFLPPPPLGRTDTRRGGGKKTLSYESFSSGIDFFLKLSFTYLEGSFDPCCCCFILSEFRALRAPYAPTLYTPLSLLILKGLCEVLGIIEDLY